jgi:hypothetical protein
VRGLSPESGTSGPVFSGGTPVLLTRRCRSTPNAPQSGYGPAKALGWIYRLEAGTGGATGGIMRSTLRLPWQGTANPARRVFRALARSIDLRRARMLFNQGRKR